MTHICVSKLTIIVSDNGLSPDRRQVIIWTNAGILLIGPLGTNFNEILIEIHIISFKKMHLRMSSAKWRPFCLGLNVLIQRLHQTIISREEVFRKVTSYSITYTGWKVCGYCPILSAMRISEYKLKCQRVLINGAICFVTIIFSLSAFWCIPD